MCDRRPVTIDRRLRRRRREVAGKVDRRGLFLAKQLDRTRRGLLVVWNTTITSGAFI